MKLVLLGTGGYHPNERRHTACLMLPELGLILDAGTGLFRIRDRILTPKLDIYLTHAHLDHVSGLTYLLGLLYGRRMDRVVIHGEAAKLDTVRDHLFAPLLFPVPCQYELQPLDGAQHELPGGGTLKHFAIDHPGGAVGYRLDWPDRSLAYVSDTTAEPGASYLEQIRGVDVLLHECNFSDQQQDLARLTGHSWTSGVASLALEAQVGLLVLTHIDPALTGDDPVGIANAEKIFPSVIQGEDKMELEF